MQGRKSLVAQAFSMSLGTLLSRVLGLVRESLLVALFPRTVTDAWSVAFRLPNLFRRLLGEGSLAVSFIPVFMDLLQKDQRDQSSEAIRFMNGFFTILLSILVALTFAGMFFSREILTLLVSGEGYMSVPGKLDLTVQLAQIMFVFILLISVFAYYMAILNSFGHFGLPGFAPTLFNVALIGSTLIPKEWGGAEGTYLAWGVVLGGFLQMAVLIPALIRIGQLPRFSTDWSSPGIRQVFRSVIPSWIGVGILQMTVLVNTYFASHLSEGSHTWIYVADRILELPLSLFAVSMGSALLPRLSQLWSAGQREEFLQTTSRSLQQILFVALPAGVGCAILAKPIVETLLGWGRFGPSDIEATSRILQIYSIAVITYAGVRIMVVPFYALKNTWLPAAFSAVSLGIHFFLGWHLTHRMGITGLTGSVVATSALNLILLLIAYRIRIGPLEMSRLLPSLGKALVAAGVMALVLLFEPEVRQLFSPLPAPKIWSLATMVTLGILSFFLTAELLKSEESGALLRRLKARLRPM